MLGPALAVMTRVPSIEGKSRLGSVLTPAQRETLQWAFLEDTLDKVRLLTEFKTYIAATPAAEISKLSAVMRPGEEVIAQPGGDLGQRMFGVADELFVRGHAPVVLIGTDTPDLPPSFLQRSLSLLDHCDLVFGPAFDGGYYLVGMRRLEGRIFEDIDWGTETVLEKTLAVCRKHELACGLLEPLRDIDRPEDLPALAEQCRQVQTETMWIPKWTAQLIKSLIKGG